MTRERAQEIVNSLVAMRNAATDETALAVKIIYPSWERLAAEGYTAETAGYRFIYGDNLYKTIPENHTFAEQWIPGEGTESLYERIDETHAGTLADPIPYDGNMALENGKYYSQNDVIYLGTRDTGVAVYNALADLVGLYVTAVE